MVNALQINQKSIPYRPYRRAIDETLKIPERCWPFLYLTFTRVLRFISTSQRFSIRWLSLLYVYKWTTVSVIRESLPISVRRLGDFVAHFCQPSKNVFDNKMTSFQ